MAKIGGSATVHREERLAMNPALRAEYDRLGPRYRVIEELLKARRHRKLTQTELAARMGVGQSVVSRLESGEHSPKLETLHDAASAMGYRVDIRFVRERPDLPPLDERKRLPSRGASKR